jgi:putative membrane protein
MWWHGGWDGWGWAAMTLTMALFWALVIGGVVWALRNSGSSAGPPRRDDPRDIVRDRYARGDIDEDTFERMVRMLDQDANRPGPPGTGSA